MAHAPVRKRIAGRLLDARPDRLDLRDLQYHPPLRSLTKSIAPMEWLDY